MDHGLLRKNEGDERWKRYSDPYGPYDLNFIRVNAQKRFMKSTGAAAPEEKRKIIGEEFIRVFEEEAQKSAPWISWYREPFIRM